MKKILYILNNNDIENRIFNYDRKIKQLEEQNRKDNWHLTNELMDIFPEAKEIYRRQLKELKERYRILAIIIKDKLRKISANYNDKFSIWFYEYWLDINEGERLSEISKKIRNINLVLYPPKIKKGRMTDQMVENAKEHPFENLIESKRGFAICPFHDDKRPSFWIKNNYGHCFGCNWTGDTIAFVMETKNMSFVEAVRYLNN